MKTTAQPSSAGVAPAPPALDAARGGLTSSILWPPPRIRPLPDPRPPQPPSEPWFNDLWDRIRKAVAAVA